MERQWGPSTLARGSGYSRPLLPVILLKEYVYCPRYAYYRLFIERDFTTESMWDAKKFTINHILSALGSIKGKTLAQVKVRSLKLGLQGVVDLIILHNGHAKVIEAKLLTKLSRRSLRNRYAHIIAQAGAYAMCVEESLKIPASELGFIGDDYKVLWMPLSPWIRRLVEEATRGLHDIYRTEEPPPPSHSAKCNYCCYRNICWDR
ncbi:MAG: CRISPR-associated protein Cas4 [Thermoprotei archaeon]|nr:CRISPR-associated protein Cas4 [Thermoprotei archaeon]